MKVREPIKIAPCTMPFPSSNILYKSGTQSDVVLIKILMRIATVIPVEKNNKDSTIHDDTIKKANVF